jgi:hypothetical protein
LKLSKKFVAQSSGLDIADRNSPMRVKISKKETSSTFARRSDTTSASAHVLDLFHSGSFASDGETAPLAPPRKHPRKSSALKDASEMSVAKGDFDFFCFLYSSFKGYVVESLLLLIQLKWW